MLQRNPASISIYLPEMKNNQKIESYEKQKGICVHCGKYFDLDEMEADHITPWSKGGKTASENCQMLCLQCNRVKGAK